MRGLLNLSQIKGVFISNLNNMVKLEETVWCLWVGDQDTDYVLCEWDSDLLPPLVKKDEIRFEYNQYKNTWSYVSCTIFAAVGMISDLFNYQFTYDEIKEIDELSYTRWRIRWQWWRVQSAVKLVADRWNEKMDRKVSYYRIEKSNDDVIESVIDKLYTIDWNLCPTHSYNQDKADWMIDGTDFWTNTNWHSVDVIKYQGQRSVKDSGSTKNNVYGLKNKLSQISNFWPYFYVYVPVDDHLEEIKRLNEIKAECNLAITHLQNIWHLVNDKNFRGVLHYTADKLRAKIEDCNTELKKYL